MERANEMDEDDEPPTELYNVGAHTDPGDDDEHTSFDATADLKAVLAHARVEEQPPTPPTMVLPADQFPPGPPPEPPVYGEAPASPSYAGWGPGGAPPGQAAPPAPQAAARPNNFAKLLLLSAVVTFVFGGVVLGVALLAMSLS